jgi:hypothetical protein
MKAPSRSQVVGGLLTATAIVASAIAMFTLGSPAEERVRRLDQRRTADSPHYREWWISTGPDTESFLR